MTGSPDVPVRIRGLRRTFGSVVALDDARLEVRSGEVHALVGENGAGKTTLLSILAGHLTPDSGTIEIDSAAIPDRGWTTREAWDRGVGMVHQHFALVPRLTGLENLSLGVRRARAGWALPTGWIRERVEAIREETGLDVDLRTPVEQLSVGERQRLEIMKVLLRDPRILVLDEPTAVLAPSEVDGLLTLLRRLAGEGRAVLLVAHKLDEVLRVADRITVLRNGHTVLEEERRKVTARSVAEAMVGDAQALDAPERTAVEPGEIRARWLGRDDGADLELRAGEIVGVAGVEGNGQRALARALAGRQLPDDGRVHLPDGIAYIPQDRGHEGLIGSFDLTENVALGHHADPAVRGGPGRLFLRWNALTARTREMIHTFGIRTSGSRATAASLSGGNQQRLVVARELHGRPELVVAENPTRGLDVAGARFVHDQLRRLRGSDDAPAIVLVSTDLEEVLALSDRICTIVRGRLTEVPADERTREGVGARMLEAGE
ncbi:MAG TPA: ATP-binding cassette domain-containing protein [Longimicrobiales bacterium]|nr:ATP-binding cassette domain-containing protein [Longimicrobiales bacterium]